jgi:hypothetical protein
VRSWNYYEPHKVRTANEDHSAQKVNPEHEKIQDDDGVQFTLPTVQLGVARFQPHGRAGMSERVVHTYIRNSSNFGNNNEYLVDMGIIK